MTAKIISWNINSIRARLEHLNHLLSNESPDILLLQETKVMDEQFPASFIDYFNYNYVINGQKSYNGVSVFSKHPIELITKNIPGTNPNEARFLLCHTNNLTVGNVYIPNGVEVGAPQYYYKLEFINKLTDLINEYKNNEFVLCGDFNVTFDDYDVYNPKTWHEKNTCSTLERNAIKEFINDNTMIDSFRYVNQDYQNKYTWWNYRAFGYQNNYGLRIDYALTSVKLKEKIVKSSILKQYREMEKPSDHAPLELLLS